MIAFLKLFGLVPWLAGKLLARKPGRTEQRATFLASVISWAGLALVALAAFILLDWWDDRNAGAQGRQDTRSAGALAATAAFGVRAWEKRAGVARGHE